MSRKELLQQDGGARRRFKFEMEEAECKCFIDQSCEWGLQKGPESIGAERNAMLGFRLLTLSGVKVLEK